MLNFNSIVTESYYTDRLVLFNITMNLNLQYISSQKAKNKLQADLSTSNWSLPWDVGVVNSISTKGAGYPLRIIVHPKNHEILGPAPLGNDYYYQWEAVRFRHSWAFIFPFWRQIERFSISRIN